MSAAAADEGFTLRLLRFTRSWLWLGSAGLVHLLQSTRFSCVWQAPNKGAIPQTHKSTKTF